MGVRQRQALGRRHCISCHALLDGIYCDTRIRSANLGDDIFVIINFESLRGIDKETLMTNESVRNSFRRIGDQRNLRSSWDGRSNQRRGIRDLPGPSYSAYLGRRAKTHRGNLIQAPGLSALCTNVRVLTTD
jgi:hypothetical protein